MFNPNDTLKETLKELIQEFLDDKQSTQPARFPEHDAAIEPWTKAITQGTFDGRPFSQYTIGFYTTYVKHFIHNYRKLNFENLEQALNEIPIEQYSKRSKYHHALICFGKYLIRNHSLSESFLTMAKAIKPKRHIPPKRTSINEEQLKALIQACRTSYELLIVLLLSTTGLRAGEFCALKRRDFNLEEGFLIVENGKWAKRRRVGLNTKVLQLLETHISLFQIKEQEEHVFLDTKLQPLTKDGLRQRLYAIGKRAGVQVSPHVLRRAFVTLNANKGRSLVMLQIACGHSDIKTTRSYCQTSEDEVIQAMKEWTY